MSSPYGRRGDGADRQRGFRDRGMTRRPDAASFNSPRYEARRYAPYRDDRRPQHFGGGGGFGGNGNGRMHPYVRRDNVQYYVRGSAFEGRGRGGIVRQPRGGFRGGRGGRGGGGGRRDGERDCQNRGKVSEDKLDNELESYWKKGGDEKAVERFESIKALSKEAKEKKEKEELDSTLQGYWQVKDASKEANSDAAGGNTDAAAKKATTSTDKKDTKANGK